MSEDTIIPVARLEGVTAELKKYQDVTAGGKDVYKLELIIEADEVEDPRAMRALRRAKLVTLTLEALQKPLPKRADTPHPGQLTVLDGLGQQGEVATHFWLQLRELPTDAKILKKAQGALRKITGLKQVQLLEELEFGLPILIRHHKHGEKMLEPDAYEIKKELEELGCVVSIEGDGAAPQVIPEKAPAVLAPAVLAKVMLDQVVVGSQWIVKSTGTQIRVHQVREGQVYAASLQGLYDAMPAWTFIQAADPATERLDSLDEIDLAKFENAQPIGLKILGADPVMSLSEVPLSASVLFKGKVAHVSAVDLKDGQPVVILTTAIDGEAESQNIEVSPSEMVEIFKLHELSPLVMQAIAALLEASSAETEGHQHLVGQYFVENIVGEHTITFKVLQVDDAQARVLSLYDGNPEDDEWEDLAQLLEYIADGKVRPATEAEIAIFDASDEARVPAGNLVQFPGTEEATA